MYTYVYVTSYLYIHILKGPKYPNVFFGFYMGSQIPCTWATRPLGDMYVCVYIYIYIFVYTDMCIYVYRAEKSLRLKHS